MFSKFVLEKVSEFFSWVFDALEIDALDLPVGIATMTSQLMSILTKALRMVAWLFPPELWTALVNLTSDVLFIMLNIHFLYWVLDKYRALKGK